MHKLTLCVKMYVCMYEYDVRHDMQIHCTRYLAINHHYTLFLSECYGTAHYDQYFVPLPACLVALAGCRWENEIIHSYPQGEG